MIWRVSTDAAHGGAGVAASSSIQAAMRAIASRSATTVPIGGI